MGWLPKIESTLTMQWNKQKEKIEEMKVRYEDKGFTGLEYSDMDVLFSLEVRIVELESRLKMYEQSLKQIAESDTLEFSKRTARIALG
jgi:Ni,Fe-hydrogenase III large subunit